MAVKGHCTPPTMLLGSSVSLSSHLLFGEMDIIGITYRSCYEEKEVQIQYPGTCKYK